MAYSNGATSAANAAVITSALTSAMGSWTSAASGWRVQITQPGCDVQKLRLVFSSTITSGSANVAVTVDNKTPATLPDGTTEQLRSYVRGGTEMNFFVQGPSSISWTMIHEVGHTLGLPDEYTYNRSAASPAPTCTYKGADNPDKSITLSASRIPPAAVGQHSFDNASVMGESGNTNYPDNLFYWVAIEVKKILADEGVSADVKIVAR
ncbi:hypothetical protein [uncultured Litoreibacter sp.]|uniref:hypothetical protein n=1 Tax=uncultured Litoreibacter sp. TaxID=1392394 RepID=UPI0026394EEA|nr:hypothetical protein [uncultured Litoreibacter sp.]